MDLPWLMLAALAASLTATGHSTHQSEAEYLPGEAAAQVVSVSPGEGGAEAGMTVLTEAVAVKETGPKATVARFGEVYAFANLQADDQHDFMLVDPDSNVLMKVPLPALAKTSYVFTFHREGLFNFYCTMHQPEMSGQILVLPPVAALPAAR
jgi:plastocyanin